MNINTINTIWELDIIDSIVNIKEQDLLFYNKRLGNKSKMSVNKNIKYINYNIFELIYNTYCNEFNIEEKYAYNIFGLLLRNKKYFSNFIKNKEDFPNYISIENIHFDIAYKTRKHVASFLNDNIIGYCFPAQHIIYIVKEELDIQKTHGVIVHEMVHALFYYLQDIELFENEKYVGIVASIISHVLRSNKELMSILLTKEDKDIINYIEKAK